MNQSEMIQSLRAEIAKLQRVLDLLLDHSSTADEVRRPGRPTGSGNKAVSFNPEEFAPKKRTMSAEGRVRIAAAQKKRWAAQKSATPDRVVRKQTDSPKKVSKTVPSKSARKVESRQTKKGATAGKRTGLTQKRATTAATSKTVKKIAVKKTSKPATKRPAKQMPPAGPELRTAE